MDFKEIIKFVLKNIGIFIIGGIFGIALTFFYIVYIWTPEKSPEIGIGIIAIIIPMIIILGSFGAIFGGIFGLILFYIIKYLIKLFKHLKK